MDRLPAEVLELLIALESEAYRGSDNRLLPGALAPALVCRRWVEPSLKALHWTIAVESTRRDIGAARDRFEALGAHLAARPDRAAQVETLVMMCNTPEDAGSRVRRDFSGLLTVVGLRCSRLRSLFIRLSEQDGFEPSAVCLAAVSHLKLDELSIQVTSKSRTGGDRGAFDMATAICGGQSADTLVRISLYGRGALTGGTVTFGRPLPRLVSLKLDGVDMDSRAVVVAPRLRCVYSAWDVVSRLPNRARLTHLDLQLYTSGAPQAATLHGFESLRVLSVRRDPPSPFFWTTIPPSVTTLIESTKTVDAADLVRTLASAAHLVGLRCVGHGRFRSAGVHEALGVACALRGVRLVDMARGEDRAMRFYERGRSA